MAQRTRTHTDVDRRLETTRSAQADNVISKRELTPLTTALSDPPFGRLAEASSVVPRGPDPRLPEFPNGWR